MIRNEEIRRRTGMETIEDVIKKTRLRWLGHLHGAPHRRRQNPEAGNGLGTKRVKKEERKTKEKLERHNHEGT